MNLIRANAAITMSSREIAELLDCRHDNVKRTIERLAAKAVIVRPPMEEEQSHDSLGRLRVEAAYRVGKRDSYVVVAQLSPEFTARLVDRWQELEAAVAQPAIPTNFVEALRLALQLEEKNVRPCPRRMPVCFPMPRSVWLQANVSV